MHTESFEFFPSEFFSAFCTIFAWKIMYYLMFYWEMILYLLCIYNTEDLFLFNTEVASFSSFLSSDINHTIILYQMEWLIQIQNEYSEICSTHLNHKLATLQKIIILFFLYAFSMLKIIYFLSYNIQLFLNLLTLYLGTY